MRSRRVWAAAMVLSASLMAIGCSAGTTDISAQTSEDWQTRVVAIAEHVAASDPSTALADLAALEAEALAARESGEIGAARATAIQEAIALVRADLQSAASETETPALPSAPPVVDTPAPGVDIPAPDVTSGNNGNNGNDGNNGNNGNNGNGKGKDG